MGQATNGIFHVLQVSQTVLRNFQNEMENFPEHSSKIKVFIISIQLVNFLFCMSTTHKSNWQWSREMWDWIQSFLSLLLPFKLYDSRHYGKL